MLNFDNFLTESLNMPVDFYMTEDTEMPKRVFGAFVVNDTQYGCSIEETNMKKIYELKVYRIVGSKMRRWSFKSPSDFRPVLATVLKFTEACVPFLKTKMDGVFVRLPTGKNAERVNKLGQALIKRVYFQAFKHVPVTINHDVPVAKSHIHDFLFFARKLSNPKALFNAKVFKKYNFVADGTVPTEMALDIKAKKPEKPKVSTKPSVKFSFGQLTVKIDDFSDPAMIDQIDKASKEPAPVEDTSEKDAAMAAAKAERTKVEGTILFALSDSNVQKIREQFIRVAIENYPKDKLKKQLSDAISPFNEPKTWYDTDLYYIVNNMLNRWRNDDWSKYENFIPALKKYGMIDNWGDWEYGFRNVFVQKVMNNIKAEDAGKDHDLTKYFDKGDPFEELTKMKELSDRENQLDAEIEGLSDGGVKPGIVHEKSAINPSELPYDLKGAGQFTVRSNGRYYEHEEGSVQDKANDILQNWGLQESIDNDLSSHQRSAIYNYTGSAYSDFNDPLRGLAKSIMEEENENTKEFKAQQVVNFKRIQTMQKAFEKIKPLPKPLWVYRGGWTGGKLKDYLEVGSDYVETAFTSTSIKSQNTFGEQNLRLAIYLPAGSRVIPALEHDMSKHANEKEVILPPMSVFRIIERTIINPDTSFPEYHVVCVYKGSGAKDFLTEAKEYVKEPTLGEQVVIDEQKKGKDYDPNGKFGSKVTDEKLTKKILSKFKSGKWNLDTKKKKGK